MINFALRFFYVAWIRVAWIRRLVGELFDRVLSRSVLDYGFAGINFSSKNVG